MRALLDTNIIVDVLQSRGPWYMDGQKIFLAAAKGQFTGCITAKEATDIHYFSRKYRGLCFITHPHLLAIRISYAA